MFIMQHKERSAEIEYLSWVNMVTPAQGFLLYWDTKTWLSGDISVSLSSFYLQETK